MTYQVIYDGVILAQFQKYSAAQHYAGHQILPVTIRKVGLFSEDLAQ